MTKPTTICTGEHSDEAILALMQPHLLTGDDALRVADLFKALSDPTRVRMIGLLAHAEMCVGDLCRVLGMSQPAISHHLRVLRSAHLVNSRKQGQHVLYTLSDDHIHSLFDQSLTHVQEK